MVTLGGTSAVHEILAAVYALIFVVSIGFVGLIELGIKHLATLKSLQEHPEA